MKMPKLLFSILLLAGLRASAQNPPATPGPAPGPAPAAQTPMSAPSGIIHVLGLQLTGSDFSVWVDSPTDGAWITCTVSSPGSPPVELATGQSWVAKGKTALIALKTENRPVTPPESYDASCVPQYLTAAGAAAKVNYLTATLPTASKYEFTNSGEPDTVHTLADNSDWQPTFDVNIPGSLTLVFDDQVPGLLQAYDTEPAPTGTNRKLKVPIHTIILEEGKYYRYHFTGRSDVGKVVLAQQNKAYVLYKNTSPQLSSPVGLTSQDNGIDVKFNLTRKVKSLQLQFPSGVGLKPKSSPAGDGAALTYEFVIPTDLQAAAANIGKDTADGISKSLTDATTSGGTPTATGTVKLNIVNLDVPDGQTIAELDLSVVRVSALPLVKAIQDQNPKLGLDKTAATNVASQALNITATSSQQDKDAATALAGVLMQKGGTNFKSNLVTFLVTAGKAAAKAYGIPVP